MAEIDLQLVREFFELNRFSVMTHWLQRHDGGGQLLVENGDVTEAQDLPALLTKQHITQLPRAVIEVRPWHADRLYASLIESNPILTQFAEPENLDMAREFFRDKPFSTVLITSELPSAPDQRSRTLELLSDSPVDHVIEFPLVLKGIIESVTAGGSYASSTTLQLLQLLKRYRFIRNQQMEFHFPMEAPPSSTNPQVDIETPIEDEKYHEEEWE